MLSEAEASGLVSRLGFEHAVACLRSTAGLGNDNGERLAELTVECGQCAVEAVGVGVVEEEQFDLVCLWAAEGIRNKLRAKCGATDADHEQILKRAISTLDHTVVHIRGNQLDLA